MNHRDILWQINRVTVFTSRVTRLMSYTLCRSFVRCCLPLLCAALAAGCLPHDAGVNCPDDVPTTCPSPAPTYSADVAPVIQRHCTLCHSPDGENQTPTLLTYGDVTAGAMAKTAHDVLVQIHACNMPPSDQPPLTSDERQAILGWIVCGANDN